MSALFERLPTRMASQCFQVVLGEMGVAMRTGPLLCQLEVSVIRQLIKQIADLLGRAVKFRADFLDCQKNRIRRHKPPVQRSKKLPIKMVLKFRPICLWYFFHAPCLMTWFKTIHTSSAVIPECRYTRLPLPLSDMITSRFIPSPESKRTRNLPLSPVKDLLSSARRTLRTAGTFFHT